ncbi:ABC transporter ATP-binding protein [Mesorhizobium sp. LCM 4577]|uniref:ABC transporter ATP-binding protein n=1 Tax=unclassified Mesorhizobium TaxID=325217 RepID=UPI0008D9A8C0|nr:MULTISPECIES: ABC transporter ATP-binding protein [unclassified Mesorhizobium]OHV68780.1 ABC transporter ATP-binding protein [Mesorhizobium sp. LCM 4576]OHV69910.1 ABC transporter ATP-binding protein [Mesorhizobium sp. LCM 4577]
MLQVENLVAGYPSGGRVLKGTTFDVAKGEVVALLGRNGMGKTTLMRALAGQLATQGGSFRLDGRELGNCPSYVIANEGIGYVPQGREIFKDFTVEENLLMGVLGKPRLPNRLPRDIYDFFPVLGERRRQKAGTMSGGQQQQLAIMRCLVGQPKLLLLDEPSEGIQPSIVDEIGRTLQAIARSTGLTILVVEQNLDFVETLAGRALFMENGVIADRADRIGQLRERPELVHRYLSI